MEVVIMLGHTGVILKINMNDYKIWINETCFSYENKLHVTNSMIGQTVQYSLNQTGMINHLELVVQKTKELKGKIYQFLEFLCTPMDNFYIFTCHIDT